MKIMNIFVYILNLIKIFNDKLLTLNMALKNQQQFININLINLINILLKMNKIDIDNNLYIEKVYKIC